MLDKQLDFKELSNDVSSLQGQVKEVSLDLVLQTQQSEQLLDKLKKWQKIFTDTQLAEADGLAILQENISLKNQIKSNNLILHLAQRKLLVVAIDQAANMLRDKFSKDDVAGKIVTSALDKLDKY